MEPEWQCTFSLSPSVSLSPSLSRACALSLSLSFCLSLNESFADVLGEVLAVVVHHFFSVVNEPLRMENDSASPSVVNNHSAHIAAIFVAGVVHETRRVALQKVCMCQSQKGRDRQTDRQTCPHTNTHTHAQRRADSQRDRATARETARSTARELAHLSTGVNGQP